VLKQGTTQKTTSHFGHQYFVSSLLLVGANKAPTMLFPYCLCVVMIKVWSLLSLRVEPMTHGSAESLLPNLPSMLTRNSSLPTLSSFFLYTITILSSHLIILFEVTHWHFIFMDLTHIQVVVLQCSRLMNKFVPCVNVYNFIMYRAHQGHLSFVFQLWQHLLLSKPRCVALTSLWWLESPFSFLSLFLCYQFGSHSAYRLILVWIY